MAFSFKKFLAGIKIVPKTSSTADSKGDLEVIDSTGKLGFHNGTSVSPVLTESHSAVVTNKSIDADSNTITNIENADIKAGAAIDASKIADGSVSSTEFQYLNGVTSGIQGQLDSKATDAALAAHINDTTDAHDASAISITSIPTISSTDVQGALGELQTDISNVGSDLGAHIIDAVDAHDASAISVVPAGNIAATDVQSALQELDSEKEPNITTLPVSKGGTGSSTSLNNNRVMQSSGGNIVEAAAITAARALISDANGIPTHSAVTSTELSYVSGVTSAIQTQLGTKVNASGGTLTNGSVVTPTRLDVKQDTLVNLQTYASTASNGQLAFATDTKQMFQVVDSSLVSVGSGAGGFDSVFTLDASEQLSTWATGDNATFLGGGTLSGTFAKDTSTPLQGNASYLYTQAAGSLNDYLASPAQPVPVRFRGQTCTLYFPFTYDGASNDIRVVFWDATAGAEIPSSVYIQASTTVGIFKTNITIPSTCQSIRIGFQTLVLNSGKIFEFDSINFTSDSTAYADIANISPWIDFTPTGTWTANTTYTGKYRRVGENLEIQYGWTCSGAPTASQLSLNLPAGFTINTSKLPAIQTSGVTILGTGRVIDNGVNSYPIDLGYASTTQVFVACGVASGSFSTWGASVGNTQPFTWGNLDYGYATLSVPVVGFTASNDNILTSPETFSTDTAPLVYAGSGTYTLSTLANAPVGTFITFTHTINTTGTTVQTNAAAPTQTTADMALNGILLTNRVYAAASSSAAPSQFAIQIGKGLKGVSLNIYKSTGRTTSGEVDFFVNGTTQQGGMYRKSYNESTGILLLDVGSVIVSTITSNINIFSDGTSQSFCYVTINASKNPALTGLNVEAVAARGVSTSGQSITNSGTYVTVTFDTAKTYDTHGALNAATGVFTAPESGYYWVSGAVYFATSTYAVQNTASCLIRKNGVNYAQGFVNYADRAATLDMTSSVSTGVYLSKGDTVDFQVNNARTAGNTALNTNGPSLTHFSIHKTSVG